MLKNIPTHIIMGFLGSGKTTAILDLLAQKPANEYWAVLVNEAGETGIDGKIYSSQGVQVEEIPGGCMCCIQGVPMRVAINRLLRKSRPSRLLIESSGIGHPSGLIKTLSADEFSTVLDIKATIALLDPEKLLDPRMKANDLFKDQLACADILVANKTDIASAEALQAFDELEKHNTRKKQVVARSTKARLNIEWLNLPRLNPCEIDLSWKPATSVSPGWETVSWDFPATTLFSLSCLKPFITRQKSLRIKGFVHTDQGWQLINAESGHATYVPVEDMPENQLTVIGQQLEKQRLKSEIQDCMMPGQTPRK